MNNLKKTYFLHCSELSDPTLGEMNLSQRKKDFLSSSEYLSVRLDMSLPSAEDPKSLVRMLEAGIDIRKYHN